MLPFAAKRLDEIENLSNKDADQLPSLDNSVRSEEYSKIEEAPQRTDESLKFVVTQENNHNDSHTADQGELNNQFVIVDVYDKYGIKTSKDSEDSSSGSLADLMSSECRMVFKLQDIEAMNEDYQKYQSSLSSFKITKSFEYYVAAIRSIRLKNSMSFVDTRGDKLAMQERDEKFALAQSLVHYRYPHIAVYYTQELENEFIQKLITLPPRTRKEVFLRDMLLCMEDLAEYQKLYAFKELSWIVWLANFAKFINIAVICLINIYALFYVTLTTGLATDVGHPLFVLMCLSAVISGLCCIFIPVQKIFLAKTYLASFNSYRKKVVADFEFESSRSVIHNERKTYIALYKRYAKLVEYVNRVLHYSKTKYLVAFLHYDNLFHFVIFYLAVSGVISKSVLNSTINLFLVLMETNTLYKVYKDLSVHLMRVIVYAAFIGILIYQIGVFYYAFFMYSSDQGIDCRDFVSCIEFIATLGLIGDHGYAETRYTAFRDSSRYFSALFADTLTFEVLSFLTAFLILGSFNLTSLRRTETHAQEKCRKFHKGKNQDRMFSLRS